MDNTVIYQVTMIRVCIDTVNENGDVTGYICGVALKDDIPFKSRYDLMMKICDAYDTIGQPQASQVFRSFKDNGPGYNSYVGTPERYHDSAYIDERVGKIRSVNLIMKSRKHAEWQGLLKEIDGTVICQFKSMLEMIKAIY